MKMEYVGENEDDRNVAGDSLPSVPAVSRKSVALQIRFTASGNPNSDDRVENDWQKYERPLDHREHRQTVNREDVVLEDRRSGDQCRVRDEVHTHVCSNRHEPTQ